MTKAQTLEFLQDRMRTAKIAPLFYFKISDYYENKVNVLKYISNYFDGDVIVRSSTLDEDTLEYSNAGHYLSISNVDSQNTLFVQNTIERVISSYTDTNPCHQVLIQPMLKNITLSGVVLTSDLSTLSNYYSVNYDDSGSTTSVTNGETNDLRNYVCYKDSPVEPKDEKLLQVIQSAQEIEKLLENNALDIEFAFNDSLYILQARAISIKNKEFFPEVDLKKVLYKTHKKVKKLNKPHPSLLGKRTIFGVMPDWNPAEIIGLKPKPLTLSLYKELVTDSIWAKQRDNYGYRSLLSHPLMVSFFGQPYIDARVSFNSFIPKALDDKVADKLVDYYLDKLQKNSQYHDKVEFEILFSSFDFSTDNKLNELSDFGFEVIEIEQIKKALKELTNSVIMQDGHYIQDIEKSMMLDRKTKSIVESDLSLIDKIYWLCEYCKEYGTLPFAGIARSAFIAVSFLNSMKEQGVISFEKYHHFFNSINTVSKQLQSDLNHLTKEQLLEQYGHLRPGTYDILSPRYDEDFEYYFCSSVCQFIPEEPFTFLDDEKVKIKEHLKRNNLNLKVDDFILFLREAIENREASKFIFTRTVSKILKFIALLGERFGLDKNDMSYLDVQSILKLYSTLDIVDIEKEFKYIISENRNRYKTTKMLKLPHLISHENDIYGYFEPKLAPNYITLKSVEGNITMDLKEDLEGKIVLISSADPGYDFLFTKNIAGLITAYGGANSHMAIRCAELGLPAVIGVGDEFFATLSQSQRIFLDALNKIVKVVQ